MMTGKIIKGIAGFYYVEVIGSGIYECKAKGIFRKEGIKPCVGDEVDIEITHAEDMEANIIRIHKRRSQLYRPLVANVDQALLVFALADPKPNPGVLDRFLIQMERQELPVIICFNKCDLVSEAEAQHWMDIYAAAGYRTMAISVAAEKGTEDVRALLKDKTTVLAGPSGAGKSSLTNALSRENVMETGAISKKLKRGKQTTRHAELFMIEDGTFICDTPGFTSFVQEEIAKEDLRYYFPEFREFENKCRFDGCVHVDEPDCALKEAVKEGRIFKERYESYTQLFRELKEAEKHRY